MGFQAVLLLPQVHPLRSFVKTNTKPFAKNGEMARSKKPAERSGLKTCGFRTERGNRAAAGFCATRGSHRTRPSFQRQRVFEKAGRDPREGKHFPLLVGFGAKSQVITVIEKPKFSRSNHQTIKLTWAATIFHPLNILTHVCCCRPILSVPWRRNSVLAIAMSSPNVVIVVLIKSRSSP